ncbi:GrpB family protein [Mammaliicoccus vitulinus]|uniref:GrpB family protein n=1 Tax=Mammaliicoccus vitulinus TaxID=71237 RepID=UPI000D1E87EB|nr:GrpB family protein [Mammaliicoccus vitulinus]PTI37065.1 hypothetical protein BU074_07470 [Mammaliicoccus vitulinus]PTI69624.1 hypothetical protein BU073_11655 [Mammaliicoccus vitulinus]
MEVRLSSFDENWKTMYETECEEISSILSDLIIKFEHFGSTSIEGMKAKPVIDMIVIVKSIKAVDQFNPEFLTRGYDVAGEWGIKGRRLMRKGGQNRTHHIHIYEQGNPEIDRHIIFRDYLKEHKEIAKEYSNFKEKLASQFNDTSQYSKAKKSYVKRLENRAITWYQQNNGVMEWKYES